MQITLLPPLLPTEGAVPVRTGGGTFTPGMRIVATVLVARAGSGTLLSLHGREVQTRSPLPHPPGTTLQLEVVAGGSQPLLRLVGAETTATLGQPPRPLDAALPISPTTYGLAAAVFAARGGADLRAATSAMAQWIPQLIARGLLGTQEGEALQRMLDPIRVPLPPLGTPEAARASEALARALASRLAEGGVLLERHLAGVVRHASAGAEQLAARNLRARLSVLADALSDVPHGLEPAQEAVGRLQEALLAEQARAAAHLARDGVLDLRVPLQGADTPETSLRMRVEKDAPDDDAEPDATPWRRVVLNLACEGLGHVHVRLALAGDQLRAEFAVEEGSAADRIDAGLIDLTQALEAAGFSHVLSRVVVDPVRARAPDDMPELPDQHSIVDAQA